MSTLQIDRLTPAEAVDSVLRRYRTEGGGESGAAITHLEHAAQAGSLARRMGLPPALVVACLLHDYGRLLGATDEEHAEVGADALAGIFGPAVTEPIRLHSLAWRVLGGIEADLGVTGSSPGSPAEAAPGQATVPGHGRGPEVGAFLERPWAEDAATLRRIDEASRLPGLDSPPVEHFRSLLESVAGRHRGTPPAGSA